MSRTVKFQLSNHPDQFWVVRRRQLDAALAEVHDAVTRSKEHQQYFVILCETAKLYSEEYKAGRQTTVQAVRAARAKRTALRKLVFDTRDYIRIRTDLRDALPGDVAALLDNSQQYLDLLEASGY